MAGTRIGGLKAVKTNRNKTSIYINGREQAIELGSMYKIIGALGGRNGGSPKGLFAHGKVSPSEAGIKGGRNGKRGPALFVEDNSEFGEGFDAPTWKNKLSRRFK